MITIKNVNTLEGKVTTITIPSNQEQVIEAEGKLTFLPGLIDTQVDFCTPGKEHKEDWVTGSQAAIAGGVTTVFDLPSNSPSTSDLQSLIAKKQKIDQQLSQSKISLKYSLYVAAEKEHIESLGTTKGHSVGIKVYPATLNEKTLERLFQLAAQENMLVSVHAEDVETINDNLATFDNEKDPAVHSKIHSRQAAIKGVKKVLSLAEKYNTMLFIQNVSIKEEVELIREAKERHILVFASTISHYLFLSESDYAKWGTRVQLDPALRTKADQEALWKGIQQRTIDTIGSGHEPHTLEEKKLPYGQAPSGIPGIETMLPLLLNAFNEKKISLDQIVHTTRINPESIFSLPHNLDAVLVDLNLVREVKDAQLKTKCKWSPYSGRVLKGWPIYTILNGQVFKIA